MSEALEALSRALLLEGHLLYPYDPGAPKNRYRWLFGRLHPEACCRQRGGADASMLTECLMRGGDDIVVGAEVRFLQITAEGARSRRVDAGRAAVGDLIARARETRFSFPGGLEGAMEIGAARVGEGILRLRAVVRNTATAVDPGDEASVLFTSLLSTHATLSLDRGVFVSLRDPPSDLFEAARACERRGAFPILVGPGELLCSPIIVDDHPRVAPESAAELFDAVEIDELLTLHILALSPEEQRAMAEDPLAREALGRTLALGDEDRLRLHGRVQKRALVPGARVVLRPGPRADVLDLVLAGRAATVRAVDEDLDGRVHVAVSIDDDPGRDLGAPGHWFYFDPGEIELADPEPPSEPP